jgi:hypothetical protein
MQLRWGLSAGDPGDRRDLFFSGLSPEESERKMTVRIGLACFILSPQCQFLIFGKKHQ